MLVFFRLGKWSSPTMRTSRRPSSSSRASKNTGTRSSKRGASPYSLGGIEPIVEQGPFGNGIGDDPGAQAAHGFPIVGGKGRIAPNRKP